MFGRALHLQRTLGEPTAELAPLLRWDDADDPPHTAAEIVHGLEQTWGFITGCLMRGSPSDAISEQEALVVQTIWNQLPVTLTGSLKVMLMSVLVACCVAPFVGVVALTVGAASTVV